VRPSGSRHSWAPFTFSLKDNGVSCPKTILVETTTHFTSIIVNPPDTGNSRSELYSVSVGTGVKLRKLLETLESYDLGLFASPTIAEPTVGGMLAVGVHGSGIPSLKDSKNPGHSYGTFSNLVISMTIVAWDSSSSAYILKTLHRSEPDTKAFLTNLGRTFVTSVTLRVGRNQMLRSESHFYIHSSELFAHPSRVTSNSRTISKFAQTYGRINAISIPPSNEFWMLVWHVEPIKPLASRRTYGPFNHYIMGLYPAIIEPFYRRLTNEVSQLNRLFSAATEPAVFLGSFLTRSNDYWGPSKNHLLYFSSSLPRMTPYTFTFVTSRSNIQLVLHIARTHFESLTKAYEKLGQYPIRGDFDIRLTGLDDPKDVEVEGAESPSLSPARPIPEYPQYDVVIWMDMSAYSDTPYALEFVSRLQQLLYRDLHGKLAILRAEWAKAWACTLQGSWTNTSIIDHYSRTFSSSDEWNWAVRLFTKFDPHGIFSNDFLDYFLAIK